MNCVPSRRRNPQEPTPEVVQSVLRIPRAQAESKIAERIAAGGELVGAQPATTMELDSLAHKVERWRDFNRTWLDKNLGGEAADEYRAASTHVYGYGWAHDAGTNLKYLRDEIASEVSKLESIKDRLDIWAAEADVVPADPPDQVLLAAPIFIVHGSDTLRAESVAHTVGRATGRETIILRDQPSGGRTLIEKFEHHAAEVSYAIIVLTADDRGGRKDEDDTRPRGRQNVIFEMGYFYGLIGRDRVSVLLQPGVEEPSDMNGIVYIAFDDNGPWKTELFRELRHAGFNINL
jgi:predicted nucleotide-binding protein